jgi:hypothetical protein
MVGVITAPLKQKPSETNLRAFSGAGGIFRPHSPDTSPLKKEVRTLAQTWYKVSFQFRTSIIMLKETLKLVGAYFRTGKNMSCK